MKITIKFWLYATAFAIVAILIIISLLTNYYINRVLNINKLFESTNSIIYKELELRTIEKDFMLSELSNEEFFKTSESENLDKFYTLNYEIKADIISLKQNKFIKKLSLESNFNSLDSLFNIYNDTFNKLKDTILAIGFKDYGYSGLMRDKIHEVEDYFGQLPNSCEMEIFVLTLRRHEKDYQLRKDIKYYDKFITEIELFKYHISQSSILTQLDKAKILILLEEYQFYFEKIIELEEIVGYNQSSGIKYELNKITSEIEISNQNLINQINLTSKKKIEEALTLLSLTVITLFLLIIILLIRLSKHVVKSIKHLQKYVTRLGSGELPERIIIKRNDEIAEMTHSINILTQNLKNTKQFAEEVGQGNLNTEINVFDNKGDLGGALIEMKNRLAKLALERDENEKNNQKVHWVNEAKLKFGAILREEFEQMSEFYYKILSNLLQVIDANVGILYILNENDENKYLEVKAAIASGEQIYPEKEIFEKYYLITQCIKDKKVIKVAKTENTHLQLKSGIITAEINNILAIPLMFRAGSVTVGAIEIGSTKAFKQHIIDFLTSISKDIAITISNQQSNLKTKSLLETTQIQSKKILDRQEEIEKQKETLEEQAQFLQEINKMLELQTEKTSGSIRYAQTIQNAVLPHEKNFRKVFSDYFIIYKPKDIVSGDFYWLSVLDENKNIFLAVVDCTGHGVPGAFMSLIGINLLNEIINVNDVYEPNLILEILNSRIITSLKQIDDDENKKSNNDGMDIAISKINYLDNENVNIVFSGAKISLYYKSEQDTEIQKLEADRRSIGGGSRKKVNIDFTNKELNLKKSDIIYLFSDGFVDQNNSERKKFGTTKLISILNEISYKDMQIQNEVLTQHLESFMQKEEQRDDITFLAIML